MKFAKYKVGILVLIMMVLIQITLPYFLSYTDEKSKYTKVFENNFRLGENVDSVVFDAFLYHIQKASGYKVVFIGDSVVEGATVKDNANTIPAYFKELTNHAFPGKNVLVYNLAIPGNRSSDIYYTYRKIYNTHAADLIIMNLNYAFYSDEMLKEALIARSELYKKEIMSDEAKVLGLKYAYLESDALKLVEQWHLYGMREELSYNIFGANPRQKLFEASKKLLTLENGKQKSIPTDNSQSTLDKP
ncbi:MAG TPA: SGNH/GDSL hydrolase family protein, partial [Clostridia bacterium]|nr:SGNH/GDSL hydrolase family protein [Clostridia bacterium]